MTMFPIYVELGVCTNVRAESAVMPAKTTNAPITRVLRLALRSLLQCEPRAQFVVVVFSVAKIHLLRHNYTVVVYSHNADHRSSADHRQFIVPFDTAALWFV